VRSIGTFFEPKRSEYYEISENYFGFEKGCFSVRNVF